MTDNSRENIALLCRPCHMALHGQGTAAWARVGGLASGAVKRALTNCKHGHPFTPENTYVKPNGCRLCRACLNARKRATRTAAGARSRPAP